MLMVYPLDLLGDPMSHYLCRQGFDPMNRSPFTLVCASDLQTRESRYVFNDIVNGIHWVIKSTQVYSLMRKVEAV